MKISKVIEGDYFHTPSAHTLDYGHALFALDEFGTIVKMIRQEESSFDELKREWFAEAEQTVVVPKGRFLFPGLIDLHVHAPQWPQAGIALDEPLEVWLDQCTFPLEAKYADVDFAKEVYTDLVTNLLSRGTTTVLYFATVHKESSILLGTLCGELGQRALVGKVVMDHPDTTPETYRDINAKQALADTEAFIKAVRELDYPQGIYPVITPRFVPSCSDEVLAGLGKLAEKYQVHVQSHCSESQWEHEHVYERFGKRDTQVLADFGLLTRKSIMAHGNFLTHEDGEIFHDHGASVAHCPISNAYFANSVLPVKRLQKQGVTVGLGTDISGGFSPSLYENIRQVVMSSRMLEEGVDANKPLAKRGGLADSRVSLVEAFYLATTASGQALDLNIGCFQEGFSFDAQVIDPNHAQNRLPHFAFQQPEEIFSRIVYLADQSNIRQVFVQGKLVHEKQGEK